MANNSWVVRAFDTFDNYTLGYRFFADELSAKKFAKKYDDGDRCGTGYAVYPRTCKLYWEVEAPNGEYPIDQYEAEGAFSDLQRKFAEVIRDPAVFYARLDPWYDVGWQKEIELSYCREISF